MKAITGGVIALNGQLVKVKGHIMAAKGHLLATKGDSITAFGKHVATHAFSSPGHADIHEAGPSAPSGLRNFLFYSSTAQIDKVKYDGDIRLLSTWTPTVK